MVIVPVLSNTTVSALRAFSMNLPELYSTPFSAAAPEATMSAVGVASPKAHGQATDSTSQQVTSAFSRSCGLNFLNHSAKVAAAAAATAGTNQPATESANFAPALFRTEPA